MDTPRPGRTAASDADFVVVANRLPLHLDTTDLDAPRWRRSPGGLVSALEPILRTRRGAWAGWAGTVTGGAHPALPDQDTRMHPVPLTEDEYRDYYEGFSNATLWPLFHDAVVPPDFDQSWWHSYLGVNQRFAQHAAALAGPGATVWVQDYQLMLVPAMLRALRPDVRIGFFLHIPFPPPELFLQLPWRSQIVDGLLGADLIGFQLPGGAENFLQLVRRLRRGEDVSRAPHASVLGRVLLRDREVRVGAFPISVDAAGLEDLARSEPVRERTRQIRRQLGERRRIMLGVDRLDYTKGIDQRLRAFEGLLAAGRATAQDTVLVQIATPSRERIGHYRRQRARIEARVGQINGAFGQVGQVPVHYLHTTVDRSELAALYGAADVMLVTPLRDGMNLVAKEFVAARPDLGGSLVLSEFAGAAQELTRALLVNPHHPVEFQDVMAAALGQDETEGRRRMRDLRHHVRERDVHHWAHSFLAVLHGGSGSVPSGPGATPQTADVA
ncbi:trehalose-6-phosphate synthase [Streptomyces pluripotens]|uniref:Trehalose-6-phosphate synthase n=1 Tax=Streptomyces pluripotens TaxID=1355015 RepID=A0A221P6F3_9ACTN|nr:trehalose-6-phosphate synthase [Streptomyces pluripotens]ARP73104.1 trehalose-6-phosphate synthase [Streptomyces pluripotens]ASN27355.1 trehalose-6-phosphate synthase [Streptomyces pluripotens]